MDRHETGQTVGNTALDAIAALYERITEPELLAVSVTLVAEDEDEIRVVTRSWGVDDHR